MNIKIRNLLNSSVLPCLGISLVSILSTYKTIGFYFWRDDFTVFYGVRLGQCNFYWPYNAYCFLFGFLYKLLGYNPHAYFLLGVALFVFASIGFYLLVASLLDKKVAFLTASIFATAYFGNGVFTESYDPIISFLPLGLLFFSLIFIFNSVKKTFNKRLFILGSLTFIISISSFYARTSTYIIPVLLLFFILPNKLDLKKKIILSAITTSTYIFAYLIIPFGLQFITGRMGITRGALLVGTSQLDWIQKIDYFLRSLSTFIIIEPLQDKIIQNYGAKIFSTIRMLTGLAMFFLTCVFIFRGRVKTILAKIRLYSLLWIIFMYLPYGFVASSLINATDRYMIFTVPGILLLWGSFYKMKVWKLVSIFIIVLLIIQSNATFNEQLTLSSHRENFYSSLHKVLPAVSKGSVFYFDFPQSIRSSTDDFFHVGSYPAEATLGAEYVVDYKTLTLMNKSDLLSESLKSGKLKADNVHSFYYDGNNIIDMSERLKKILNGEVETMEIAIGKQQDFNFVSNKSSNLSSGYNPGLDFDYKKFEPLSPAKIKLKINASIPEIPLPYSQSCGNCEEKISNLQRDLSYLSESRLLMDNVSIKASSTGEDSSVEYLIDKDTNTSWFADKRDWRNKIKPSIEMNFKDPISLDGLIIFSPSLSNMPKDMEFYFNHSKVNNYQVIFSGNAVKVLIRANNVSSISLKILSTQGNEPPLLSIINLIPVGFSKIPVEDMSLVRKSPATFIKTEGERKIVTDYLSSGADACLQWGSPGYGKGQVNFVLKLDDQSHTYTLDLPTMGVESPSFHLGCLNYPSNVFLESASIEYPRF